MIYISPKIVRTSKIYYLLSSKISNKIGTQLKASAAVFSLNSGQICSE